MLIQDEIDNEAKGKTFNSLKKSREFKRLFFLKYGVVPRSILKYNRCNNSIGCPCGLDKTCLTPMMKPSGEAKKKILIVAEAPGETEDKQGTQLVGESGQLLRRELQTFGIDLDKDCRKINAIDCKPPKNRKPNSKEIAACRQKKWDEIKLFKPKVILLLGSASVESFIGDRFFGFSDSIGLWRGWQIPDRKAKAWVIPTFHPSYLLRNNQTVLETIFRSDIQKAINCLDKVFPEYKDEQEQIHILESDEQIIYELKILYNQAMKNDKFIMAFDYETTGLKPHAQGHRIVSMAICYEEDRAIAFPMSKHFEVISWIKRVLRSKNILKIAHNMKFEDCWTEHILNTSIHGWYLDTMLASHLLDNRSYSTSLKFQSYVNFGVVDYSSHISPFLEGQKNNANSFNQIEKIPLKDLLIYNGIDALLEYRLALKQLSVLCR